ncbi:hypothetical protein LWF15_02225 [Kineosporia rhizophila]|uniref:hypothetical protein n=1 Tax=Kineosporia rhizophila TaxID=84633 RepID=UPI001E4C8FF1|nr:hypothetical protein [Kineosporia rhizophila]MCE0534316.1 hypothetical protein [Kineosporia rhizophila]
MSLIVRRPDRAALPDAGPSSIRYLAVLTGSCLVVLVTVVLTPVLGHGVRKAFCGNGDTACATPVIAAAAETRCQVLSHADVVPDDAVLFTDDLGSSGRLTLSRTVDKNAVVHWFVRRDNVPGSVRGGELTEFPTESAARAYITAAQHEPVRRRLRSADPTGLLARIAEKVDGHPLPGEMVRQPHAYFVDAGSAPDLAAQARSAVGGGIVGGGVAGVAEVRVTQEKQPSTTIFVELTEKAGESFRLGTPGSATTVAGVTFDRFGRARYLVIETAGGLRGWLSASAGTPEHLLGTLLDVGEPEGSDLTSDSVESEEPEEPAPFVGRATIRIDLLRSEPAGAAADVLHWLGVPLLLDLGQGSELEEGQDPVQRLYALLDAGAPGTSVTVSAYRTAQNASPEVGLGMLGGLTVRGALPGDDFYYAPGQGLVRWQTCAS